MTIWSSQDGKKKKKEARLNRLPSFFPGFWFKKDDVKEGIWKKKKKKQISIIWLHAKVPLRLGYQAACSSIFSFSPPILWVGEVDQDPFPIRIVHMYVHMTFGRSIIDRTEKEGPLTANNAALCNKTLLQPGARVSWPAYLPSGNLWSSF